MDKCLLAALLLGTTQALRRASRKTANPGWSRYSKDWPFLNHCINPKSSGGLLNFDCATGSHSDFDRDSRIGIVGGGPAGVSIAKLLDDRGFKNIVLFEANDRLGGKSKRWAPPGLPTQVHEMGTCFLTGKYECIRAWGQLAQMHEVVLNDSKRYVESDEAVLQSMKAPDYGTSTAYAADYAFQHLGIAPANMPAALQSAMAKYPTEWANTMGQYEYMFPSEDDVNISALNQTYLGWLRERDLTALLPILMPTMSGQGYGDPKDIPALYGLMWCHPNLIVGGPYGSGTTTMFREGYQTFWERLIAGTSVEVRLNTPVVNVNRKMSDVTITYSRHRRHKKEVVDWIVMAAPMPQSLHLLEGSSKKEQDLFGAYSFHEMSLTTFRVPGTGALPSNFEIIAWSDRLAKQTDYYRMVGTSEQATVTREMYNEDFDDGPTAIRHDANIMGFSEPVVGVLQINHFNQTDSQLTRLAVNDAKKYGMKLEYLARDRWDYMPHFTVSEVVQDRKPWRIWDLQGKTRTWWVGSHVSFESAADVLDYNLKLVNVRLCGGA